MINIIIGLIPGLIWFIIVFFLTKKNLPNKKIYLLITIILGFIGSYLCYRLEMHYGSYFKKVKDSTYIEILFYAIFGVAIFEEGYKWFITFISSILSKEKNILLNSLITSISFATCENILFYANKYSTIDTLFRIFTAFPSHICNSIFLGYFLSKALINKNNRLINIVLSIIIPIITHGLYNSFLYGAKYQEYFYYYYFLLIGSTIYLIFKIKRSN